MKKIKVGNYLRTGTKVGEVIKKWKHYKDKEEEVFEIDVPDDLLGSFFETTDVFEDDIRGYSKSVLDLIKVADLLYVDISPDDCGGIVVPRIAETENELKIFKGYIKTGQWVLKGIVTKEQLEMSCYWL